MRYIAIYQEEYYYISESLQSIMENFDDWAGERGSFEREHNNKDLKIYELGKEVKVRLKVELIPVSIPIVKEKKNAARS